MINNENTKKIVKESNMTDQKKIIFIIILIAGIVLTSCTRNVCIPTGKAAGSIVRDNARYNMIDLYKHRILNLLDRENNNKQNLIAVGHRAGNYRKYPVFPDEIPPGANSINDEMPKINITESMVESFENINLDAIEVDVQSGPGDDNDSIYIVHERIPRDIFKKDLFLRNYLKNNTLEKLLNRYIQSKYYMNNKHLYIEIKCLDAYKLDGYEEKVISRTLEIIDSVISLQNRKEDSSKIKKHISFISSNYLALKLIKRRVGQSHKLYLIAGSNSFWNKIGNITCDEFNSIDDFDEIDDLRSMIYSKDIIDGIYFDPKFVNNYSSVFHKINQRRKENNSSLKEFEFFISTYKLDFDDFFESLHNEKKSLDDWVEKENAKRGNINNLFNRNVKGLIFDIDP